MRPHLPKILMCLYLILIGVVDAQNAPIERTIIDSDRVILRSTPGENVFTFEGNVRIEGTNLVAKCDILEVIATRDQATNIDQDPSLIGQIGGIESLIATGNVRIEQEGRIATGGLAKIFPKDGYIELLEDPVFIDVQGARVEGKRIVLEQGKQQARVEGYETGDRRARVILPAFEDLGVDIEEAFSPPEASGEDKPAEKTE